MNPKLSRGPKKSGGVPSLRMLNSGSAVAPSLLSRRPGKRGMIAAFDANGDDPVRNGGRIGRRRGRRRRLRRQVGRRGNARGNDKPAQRERKITPNSRSP